VTFKLVIENLKHRPMRSLLSILLIAVPVTLILTLAGMTDGMLEDSRQRTRGSGADVLVRGSTAAAIATFSGTLDERYAPVIQRQPHVSVATGVLVHSIDPPLAVMGIDLNQFTRMNGGFHYMAGGGFQGPDDMLVDNLYAAQKHLKVGDSYQSLNHGWRICGIVETGKLIRIAVPAKTLQQLDDIPGKVSVIYVKADVPAHADLVAEELRQLLPSLSISTVEEWTSQLTVSSPQLSSLRIFTNVVIGIGVVIAFAVVCLAQYMAVLQRTREIGILKSLGAAKSFILGIILAEALGLGIGGSILGILMSYGAKWLINMLVPASIQMAISYQWWPTATAITLVAAALGALYPGLSAARHDPIEALAYE